MKVYKVCRIVKENNIEKYYNTTYKSWMSPFSRTKVEYSLNRTTKNNFISIGLFAFKDIKSAYKFIKHEFEELSRGEDARSTHDNHWILFECEANPYNIDKLTISGYICYLFNKILDFIFKSITAATPEIYMSYFNSKDWCNDSTILCKTITPERIVISSYIKSKLSTLL